MNQIVSPQDLPQPSHRQDNLYDMYGTCLAIESRNVSSCDSMESYATTSRIVMEICDGTEERVELRVTEEFCALGHWQRVRVDLVLHCGPQEDQSNPRRAWADIFVEGYYPQRFAIAENAKAFAQNPTDHDLWEFVLDFEDYFDSRFTTIPEEAAQVLTRLRELVERSSM